MTNPASMKDWPWEKRAELYQKAFARYGKGAQFLMAIEEMAELTKAILKLTRAGGNPAMLVVDVLAELADVEIMLEQLRLCFGNMTQTMRERNERMPDIGVDSIKAKKLERLQVRLETVRCPECNDGLAAMGCERCGGTGRVPPEAET